MDSVTLLSISDIDFPVFSTQRILLGSVAILCALFLGITFAQSAFDKLTDYKGNREYFNAQFGKSPLRKMVGMLLPVITILETVSGILCLSSIIFICISFNLLPLVLGLMLAAFTLLCLLFGQRLAKDYAGSAALTGYFIVAVLGLIAFAFAI